MKRMAVALFLIVTLPAVAAPPESKMLSGLMSRCTTPSDCA